MELTNNAGNLEISEEKYWNFKIFQIQKSREFSRKYKMDQWKTNINRDISNFIQCSFSLASDMFLQCQP